MHKRITSNEIMEFKNTEIHEDKFLDFKQKEYASDGKDMLEHICSFANGSGGNIIIGVKEKRENGKSKLGYIDDFQYFSHSEFEPFKEKITNKINTCISPKLFSCDVYSIDFNKDGCLFGILINSSLNKPHMINGTGKFYIRTSNGKTEMDIDLIKTQILDNEFLEKRIENFHLERCSHALQNKIHDPENKFKLLINIIPVNSLSRSINKIDPITIKNAWKNLSIVKKLTHNNYRYNLEGLCSYYNNNEEYVQFFKNGIIEFFSSRCTIYEDKISDIDLKNKINIINECMDFYEELSYPLHSGVVFFVSIFGIKNCSLESNGQIHIPHENREKFKFDRNDINLNEFLPEINNDDLQKTINNLLTDIAQASGMDSY